jgi:hypothetical protein
VFARVVEAVHAPEAPPPRQDGRRRHPAQDPDGVLAVGREDPVRLRAGVQSAGLGRFFTPVERVGADPALTLEGDGALVEDAEQHQPAVHLRQVFVAESVGDFSIRDISPITDDA